MRVKLIEQFRAARRAGCSLVGIETPDPAATITALMEQFAVGDPNKQPPILQWDIVRGLRGLNDAGGRAIAKLLPDLDPKDVTAATSNPVEVLALCARLPKGSIFFYLNAQRYLENEAVMQGVWNLRDEYKADMRQFVPLGVLLKLPAELEQDVVMLSEELPSPDDLRAIVTEQHENAGLDLPAIVADKMKEDGEKKPSESQVQAKVEGILDRAVDALRGLAAFPAEQVTAMSLTKKGVRLDDLWERKRKMIEQTPGLSVWRGGERFADVGGSDNAKSFFHRVKEGNDAPRTVVFFDEIEKSLAGAGTGVGDTSGVSQALLGTMLTYMQDNNVTGSIFIGPPGSGKSALAKAIGAEMGIPTIPFDMAGMKASLVGESEANLRRALKVVTAVSGGAALFIATCNSIGVLPPELRRRFTFGTFFFDLPDATERAAIWNLYLSKFKLGTLDTVTLPDDEGWTGAEIRQCASLAWRLKCDLTEAATFIVPVAKSAADMITKLRSQASGKYISAAHPGVYRMPEAGEKKDDTELGGARAIRLDD